MATLSKFADLDLVIFIVELLTIPIFGFYSKRLDFLRKTLDLNSLEYNYEVDLTWEIFFAISWQVLNARSEYTQSYRRS